MPTPLDDTDRRILDLLQRDARLTNAAIAAEVGLTAPSVFERIRKLEGRGVISNYTITIDPNAVGKMMTAFIRFSAEFDDKYKSGAEAVSSDPDVLEFYNVAGEDCFVVKTRVSNPGELEALLNRIRSHMTVQRSVTMIALSALKENGPLNVTGADADPKPAAAKRANHAQR